MRKRISLKTRRPDLSRRDFREYYENNHVPLGLSFIEQFGWRRYFRNHVIATKGSEVDFDCYTEFWVDDDFDDEVLNRFLHSPDFRKLDEDDRRFLDINRRLSFEVREDWLKGLPHETVGTDKCALIWRNAHPVEDADTVANRIVNALGECVTCAILDRAIQPLPPDAPFDTLLTLYVVGSESLELSGELLFLPARWSLLELDPVETPPEQLLGGLEKQRG